MKKQSLALAVCVVLGFAGAELSAHESKHTQSDTMHAPAEQMPWGIAGDADGATRTIAVSMADNMRFAPDRIEVREGETVKFLVRNDGKALHEFVLGTAASNAQHAAMMRKFPGMEHDEPHMAHVGAGKVGALVWTFNRQGEFEYACLIPGHYEAGMKGRVRVLAK